MSKMALVQQPSAAATVDPAVLALSASNQRRLGELTEMAQTLQTPKGKLLRPMVAPPSASQTATTARKSKESPSTNDENSDPRQPGGSSTGNTSSRKLFSFLQGRKTKAPSKSADYGIQHVVPTAPDMLWSTTVEGDVLPQLSAQERARQEAIHELHKTERTFMESLLEINMVRPMLGCREDGLGMY